MESWSEGLDPTQRRAATHPGGPLLVHAGPGTGKTRTLTARIAWLVRKRGVPPSAVLAVTFTNRAAREMRERLDRLLGGPGGREGMFVGTFHAFGLELLREEWARLGFAAPPVVYDEDDRRALLREVLRELELPAGARALERVLARLDRHAVRGNAPPAGREEDGMDPAVVHARFQACKRSEGAVDFADLVTLAVRLLEEHREVLDAQRRRYRHLFVDEYQDVNPVQVRLLRLLGEGSESLMAIGDPDQAIYSFRGSDPESFRRFPELFPGTKTVRLAGNYRCSVTITSASDRVIRAGARRPEDRPAAAPADRSRKGVLLEVRTFATARQEASFVARRIAELCGGTGRYGMEEGGGAGGARGGEEACFGFGDFAVLYRLNAQAADLAAALSREGIPFQRVGTGRSGPDPLERAVLAAARLCADPRNRTAWRVLERLAVKKARLRTESMCDPAAGEEAREPLLLRAGRALSDAVPEEGGAFLAAAERLSRRAVEEGLASEAFLAAAPLLLSEDPFEARSQKVTLSTLHAAKGLEFPVVFISGLEHGLMPFLRGDEEDPAAAEEEERRLLYVGMTRAKERLFLTRCRGRFLFGRRLSGEPSPFLEDLTSDLARFVQEPARKRKAREEKKDASDGQLRLF